jgi:osmotically-inducible protein OsmY
MDSLQYDRREIYENRPTSHCCKAIDTLFTHIGCQTITELTHIESDKRCSYSKAVRENFLKDKAVDLTMVNVKTTNGSVDLSGTVSSLEAREHAVKLAWRAPGVQSVVNHLVVQK